MPSLRGSIADPYSVDRWPELTVVTTRDVVVGGVSMVRLTELCGTPCVHTAAAVIPGTLGRPSRDLDATVVLVTVTSAEGVGTARRIEIDGRVDEVGIDWPEVRLIGRCGR